MRGLLGLLGGRALLHMYRGQFDSIAKTTALSTKAIPNRFLRDAAFLGNPMLRVYDRVIEIHEVQLFKFSKTVTNEVTTSAPPPRSCP